jgi:hypothetical protein
MNTDPKGIPEVVEKPGMSYNKRRIRRGAGRRKTFASTPKKQL